MEINIPEVKVSCCVVKPKGRIMVVTVVNNSSCPTTIAKGITVALCHRMPVHYMIEVSEELEHNENKGEAQMTNSQLHLPNLAMNLDNAYLSSEQKSKLTQMLSENRDMFAVNMQNLGKTELHYYRIDTGNARPVTQRFY